MVVRKEEQEKEIDEKQEGKMVRAREMKDDKKEKKPSKITVSDVRDEIQNEKEVV